MSKKTIIILLIALILIGAFLRIFPVRYDSVRMYDIQLVTEAFDLGDNIVKGDFSVFKMPVKYPYFFSYLLLFFYGIFYFFGVLTGLFSSASQFINYIFFHLDSFYDFARILMGIFGVALIPLVYIVTSKVVALKNEKWARQARPSARQAGLLAAFLMAFNLLHIHISHQERPHILVSFFIFLSFYFFILVLEKKSLIRFLLLGLSIGLAAGSLQNGLIALIFFGLIVSFTKFKCLFSIKFWAGIVIFLLLVVIFCPYILLAFNDAVDYWYETFLSSVSKNGQSTDGLFFNKIFEQIIVYQPALIFLFVVLLISWILLKQKIGKINKPLFKSAIIGGGLFIVVYILAFGVFIAPYPRMLASLIPFLCFFVGILFSEVFNKFKFKIVFIGILILFLLFPMIQASRFSYLLFQKETRSLAKNWIENNIPNSDLIVIERDYIRFTPLKENLQLQLDLEPDSLSRKDKFLLTLDDELYPKQSRSILRRFTLNTGGDYQFLKEQGAKYIVIFKSSIKGISIWESNLEPEIILGGGELIMGFSPFISEDSLRHSIFPCEFKNPLTDLWALRRFGPVIEIYRL